MNIFILDAEDVNQCARWHMDRHVVKMILESTQLLNNVLTKKYPGFNPIYRVTHKNHPCSLWAEQSQENFNWLIQLGLALCQEYTFRYNKLHKCQAYLELFEKYSNFLPKIGRTPFAQCMPTEYQQSNCTEAYRNYYQNNKKHLAVWTKRSKPDWWKNIVN